MASFENMNSPYIDGKKTATGVMIKNEKTIKWSSKLMVKDHYIVIDEDDNKHLVHVTSTRTRKYYFENYSRVSGGEKSNACMSG